ncbi:aminoacyl-tRNA hydrolase [Gracilimonas mengyeensis]|uniref:Peptidyl-tRNA hydrolase n=1 Tax=Gracilimonas mengyeensis TaxID=1302730 RepID=A0A521E1Y4_9BACT|nr:aminoacyl-tRNA hydrolase [Gracilimonas mengyeensis]SMO77966.1 peptidyl-tRNA hydrolase [Gracilimonas mengyeensis]
MSLIIGLGNIGQEYEGTRHNIGFEIVDVIADTLSTTFGPGDGPFVVAEGRHKGRKVVLIKPTTYMNRSGTAMRKALNRYKTDHRDSLVIYDDLNLDVGIIRLRPKGSAGGHNGIADIIEKLGTNEFPRMRFGIGSDFARGKQVDYVLSPFKKSDQPFLEEGMQKAHDAALSFVRDGISKTMNLYN